MDTGQGLTVAAFELLQKRNNLLRMFTGQLEVGQDHATDPVHAAHQCGRILLVQRIQMQNISATQMHGLLDARGCLPMGQCQIQDELATQFGNLRLAQAYIAG